MLTLGTNHPPRSYEHLSLLVTYSELLLKAPNSKLRAFKEKSKGQFKGSPPNDIKMSRGNDWQSVSTIKRDLFLHG